jgi:hypothetical protein
MLNRINSQLTAMGDVVKNVFGQPFFECGKTALDFIHGIYIDR